LFIIALIPIRASAKKFPGGGGGDEKKTENGNIKPLYISVPCMKIQGGHGTSLPPCCRRPIPTLIEIL